MVRLTGLVAAGVLAGGVVATSATLVASDPGAPAASADSLQRFTNCAELRQWYVDHSLRRVTAWGWGYPIVYATGVDATSATPVATAAGERATSDAAVSSSPTGTNVQEAGVDEPDAAKTDGHVVVRISHGDLVVTDVIGAPHRLASFPLPGGVGDQLLLVHRHAIVSGAAGGMVPLSVSPPAPGPSTVPSPMPTPLPAPRSMPNQPVPEPGALGGPRPMPLPTADTTRVVDIDLTDPAHPRLVSDRTFSGRLLTMRQYGDTVRIVTDTGLPDLDFTVPHGSGARAQDRALAHNREVVRRSAIGDWLPGVRADGHQRPLVGCADVFHPQGFAGTDTLTVTGWDVTAPDTTSSVAVTTAGDLVYSSSDRLYVATPRYSEGTWRPPSPGRPLRIHSRVWQPATEVHEFRLAGIGASYTASGTVPGSVRDRWSFDEHDGDLRVAVTRQTRDGHTDNGVVVLRDKDGRLVPVGAVHGLGPDEQIQSVRWFDDLAVLVTYRQLDPLFTVDLTDPAHPRTAGELTIPGFSGYLHPIGDHLLLGLGVDATRQGRPLGAQAAVFDISDPAHPVQLDKATFGAGSNLLAVADPHAFTWLPGQRTAFTALIGWESPLPWSRAVSLQVSPDGHLTVEHRGAAGTTTFRALPLPGGRVALVGSGVRVVGVVR
jgi:uncharacterized secreted protein with C-terminal beta-propeller domain